MDALELKSDLHKLIDKINDLTVLNAVKVILSRQADISDFWDELPEEVKRSIEKGRVQALKRETADHEQMIKKYEKWL